MWWFDTWSDLARTALVGAAAYVTLVAVLRLAGKRTLAKLNAFDLVVTVAFGSTLSAILLNSAVSWSEGAVAFALLALLQVAVAWTSSRWPRSRVVVTAEPTLVLRDGRPIPRALRDERVTREDLNHAVRGSGAGSLASVAAIVLETDGSLSVISESELGDGSALSDVEGARA
jgi:uncharacterized membrane protein YcaP (DUF421 family)